MKVLKHMFHGCKERHESSDGFGEKLLFKPRLIDTWPAFGTGILANFNSTILTIDRRLDLFNCHLSLEISFIAGSSVNT